MEAHQQWMLLCKFSIQHTVSGPGSTHVQQPNLEGLGSKQAQDVHVATSPGQALVQQSTSEEGLAEQLLLPTVPSQSGNVHTFILGLQFCAGNLAAHGKAIWMLLPVTLDQGPRLICSGMPADHQPDFTTKQKSNQINDHYDLVGDLE